MASKLISYDGDRDTFFFGAQEVTDKQIRHSIADTLRKRSWSGGAEVVDFLYVRVTVQYLLQMLDFVDDNGWFWDSFDLCTNDHDFDWNRITPGEHWGYAQDLKTQGRDDLSAAEWLLNQGNVVLARKTRRLANETFNYADRIIKTGQK